MTDMVIMIELLRCYSKKVDYVFNFFALECNLAVHFFPLWKWFESDTFYFVASTCCYRLSEIKIYSIENDIPEIFYRNIYTQTAIGDTNVISYIQVQI